MTMRQTAMVATMLGLFSAMAATWNNPAGGDMADAANWTGGLPTGGSGLFTSAVSGPLTLSADLTMGGFEFNASGALFPLDLGAGRTLTVGGTAHVRTGTTVELKSGSVKMKAGYRFFVGDNLCTSAFTVNGPNAALYGAPAGSGNNFIQVGSANSNNKSFDNRLIVTNGGLVNGWVIIGRLATERNMELCGTNTFIVTGLGSRFVSSLADFTIGAQQGLSQCLVDDHATATITKDVYLGGDSIDNKGEHWAGCCNFLAVRNGASLAAKGLYVGHNSSSNRLEISDGATVSASWLTTSAQTNVAIRGGAAPCGNVVSIRGEGSALNLSGSLNLGYVAGAWGDELDIDGGALTTKNSECYVGNRGAGNRLRVANGGVWNPIYFTYLGSMNVSNTLEVAAGGTVIVGQQFRHTAYSRHDGGTNGWNTLWIHGAGANFAITNGNPYHVGRNGISVNDAIKIEDGGTFTKIDGDICIPYSQATNAYAEGFVMSVTGEGSRYVQKGAQFVFAYAVGHASTNRNCRLYVADGGEFAVTNGNVYLCNGNAEGSSVSTSNLVHIAAGGRLVHYADALQKAFIFGNWPGAEGNRMLVEGEVLCTNTNARVAESSSFLGVGVRGAGNTLEIANGGRMTVTGPTLTIGQHESAHDCAVEVRSKAALELARFEWMNVGERGRNARCVIDDATVDATDIYRICVGASSYASNATLAVCNGATLSVPRIVVGDGAKGCSLIVSNATVNATTSPYEKCSYAGCVQIGYGTTGLDATCVIAGRDAQIRCADAFTLKNAGATLAFEIPKGGYAAAPIRARSFSAQTAGATIRVRLAADVEANGQEVDLVELDAGRTIGDLSNFAYDLPEGVRVRVREGRRLVARVGRRGLAVIVR